MPASGPRRCADPRLSLLAGLLCMACGKAPPAADAGAAIVVPAAPATRAAPTAAPASQPHATLFTGDTPAVPAAFEGLAPGMPVLAAQVIFPHEIFPERAGAHVISAPFAGLRFTVTIAGEQVSGLGIETTEGAAAGAKLRALITSKWSAGAPSTDDSGRALTRWFAPGTGLRVTHRAERDGSAHVLFDEKMPTQRPKRERMKP